MKYIRNGDNGNIVIFSEGMVHKEVANALGWEKEHIPSAGQVSVWPTGEISTFGESLTLDRKSDPDDALRIKRMMK